MPVTLSFVADKRNGNVPFFFRLTDTSDMSSVTSATDYTRIWSIQNEMTSAIQYVQTTSASMNFCVSGTGNVLNDTFSVSLSAVI